MFGFFLKKKIYKIRFAIISVFDGLNAGKYMFVNVHIVYVIMYIIHSGYAGGSGGFKTAAIQIDTRVGELLGSLNTHLRRSNN